MTEQKRFDRAIQTIPAIATAYSISRITLAQATQRGDFGGNAYKSAGTWLIDTQGEHFHRWLTAHWQQARIKGQKSQDAPGSSDSS